MFANAHRIVDKHVPLLQKRDLRELAKAANAAVEEVQQALEFIRTLDPRPAQRYNRSEARLIEPDVAFVKRDGEYVVAMNEEGLPTLRLNQDYRKLISQNGTEKDVKEYVKERYRSAIQLMRNIDQRKNTILRTCESIVRWQRDFLEHGVDAIKPMMIKEVAEEIGVHPSTVSRAVSNKYVHTPQGVFELRFFFLGRCERASRGEHTADATEAESEEVDSGRGKIRAARLRMIRLQIFCSRLEFT